MSDIPWAAREGDGLSHSSLMADALGGFLEVAANVAVGGLLTAAVIGATGLTVASGGLGACVLGAVVGVAVGVGMSESGVSEGIGQFCQGLASSLFPPTVQAHITSGSANTFINGLPAARAAGGLSAAGAAQPSAESGYLDLAKGFFSQLWRPTVATPAPGTQPKPLDQVLCSRHSASPAPLLAEGSAKVFINGQPAVRSGDRSTCEAAVVGATSPNVVIGGGTVVVRDIRSGKTPGVGLAVSALMMFKGGKGQFISNLPCMLLGGVNGYAVSQASTALSQAMTASPNPVHAATGAKVLSGDEELDFVVSGLLPIDWQRVYNSRDERCEGLFGAGWSVPCEVSVHIDTDERLIYIDEQARRIDMGAIPLGGAAFSAGEGLSVRRHGNDQLLIESEDGRYRLFEPTAADMTQLRLSQLGDRNDNRVYLDYDDSCRLACLRDTFEREQIELIYHPQWPRRVARIERLYGDGLREVLVSYAYDAAGDLAEVRDASDQVQRRFAYDAGRRMVEHQLSGGLRSFYEWALIQEREWRVIRHWTEEGDSYRFDYDLDAGQTIVTDGLDRVSSRRWNTQHQITEYTDNFSQIWLFNWNDERQWLGATDPQGGQYAFAYDEAGNLSESVDALGRRESTRWLEHWSLPLLQTDAAGNTWQYDYDARGNRTRETDPLGHTTHYRYDAHGQTLDICDASGKSQRLDWNDAGQLLRHTDCSGYATDFSYDRRGHLLYVSNAVGELTQYEHDAQGRLLSRQLPDDRREYFQRDNSGRISAHTDPAGYTTRYEYDPRGQLRQRIDACGRQVQWRYDAYGRLQTLSNENHEQYRFVWDAADRLSAQQDLDGSYRIYRYDALGSAFCVEHHPASTEEETPSLTHRFERDAMGRLLAKVTSDGRTEYQLDLLDQLTGVTFTDTAGRHQTLGFAYDALGQLLEEQGGLRHHYDELGNLIQSQLPDGRMINRLYYGSGHLHQLNLDGQVISDFERDRLHREVLRTQGQLDTRSHYDRSGRVQTRTRSSLGQVTYEYDAADNLIHRLHQQNRLPHERRQHMVYDASGHIGLGQESPSGYSETFAYDAAANLLDGSASGLGPVRHNRLMTYQDKDYRYDGFGRLIEKRSSQYGLQRFSYDAEHRLREVHNANGHTVRMHYDPLGRRIAKTELDAAGQLLNETCFTWDGLRLLQEQGNEQTSLYLYADNGYEPLARIDGLGSQQKIRYFHNDLNGLPEQLSDSEGQTLWHARYRIWGNAFEERHEPGCREEQNLRFQGQYLDRETGLHFNTFRFYDPDIGRFTTPDPIGLAGGLNLYAYAPNPIGWVDPWGWVACPKKVDALKNGPQKTVVNVKTKADAHELLSEAFPDAQKVRGIGSQDAAGIRKKHKMDQFKKRDGSVRYRKDYPIDRSTGRVYGHDDPKGTGHGELPHVNIKRSDGTMVRIDITG